MYSAELYANTSWSVKYLKHNLQRTLIAPENELFSVSTTRQKSSSSDVETFRRPACCLNVKCQQKCKTNPLQSLSDMNVDTWWADMFDFRRPRHVMKPRLASWKLVCSYMTWLANLSTFLSSPCFRFFMVFLHCFPDFFYIPVDRVFRNYVPIRWSSQAAGRDREGLSILLHQCFMYSCLKNALR